MIKTTKKLLLVFLLLIVYSYILVIQNLPDKLVVFQGENITIKTIFGINIKNDAEALVASSNNTKSITENTR